MTHPGSLTISVIIPVHNAAHTLSAVLDALRKTSPAPDEIIIVDDGSEDDSSRVAGGFGCRVVRLPTNLGAASAKNCGAAEARGDILFFTDSDILVPRDIFRQVRDALGENRCDGVVGVLDPEIPRRDFASQYKNLWMNFTYTRFSGFDHIGLFYTSVAAIRREVFSQLAGFDQNYRGASIAEDTDFGQRAWNLGIRIRLAPKMSVVHLKGYTLMGLIREDLLRAAALTRMRLRKWGQPFFTSVPISYQLAVPLVFLSAASLVLGAALRTPGLILTAGLALAAFYLFNLQFIAFLAREKGGAFTILSVLFLPLDAAAVGLGMLLGAADSARGRRY